MDSRGQQLDQLCADFRTASSDLAKMLCVGDRKADGNVQLVIKATEHIRNLLTEIERLLQEQGS
jgi:hypothetical protein